MESPRQRLFDDIIREENTRRLRRWRSSFTAAEFGRYTGAEIRGAATKTLNPAVSDL